MIPLGYCQCGCGEKTNAPKKTNRAKGEIRGVPRQYRHGHWARMQPRKIRWLKQDCGYTSPCWVWQLYIAPNGYGKVAGGWAHRTVYEEHVAPIPDGFEIDHLCRNRACVNPDHLEAVVHLENMHRGRSTKLTSEQIAEIHRIGRSIPGTELAARFNVHKTTIYKILSGDSWREAHPERIAA